MSKPKIGTNKAAWHERLPILILVALIIGGVLYKAYYLSVQPSITPPAQPLEGQIWPFLVLGFINVYKNGQLVYEGPDVLANSFYEYLPFLLGNVCALTTTDAPPTCGAGVGGWADTVFTAAPQAPSCSVSISGTSITAAPSRVPVTFATTTGLQIGVGQGTSASPSDCVLSAVAMATASVNVYAPYLGNEINPPGPCPNPTAGCVQISASFTNFPSTMTISDAMLYAGYTFASGSLKYTLIAHDIIQSVSVNPPDTLTVVYTFIFPGVQTSTGAYSERQALIAGVFAQCLSRQHFSIGSGSQRLCLDTVKADSGRVDVNIPLSPCSDTQLGSIVNNGNNKITIEASAAGKFVKIYAPMAQAGSGIQKVQYTIVMPSPGGGPTAILTATQACSAATQQSFTAGQTVGLQLTWP